MVECILMPDHPGCFLPGTEKIVVGMRGLFFSNGPGEWIRYSLTVLQHKFIHDIFRPNVLRMARGKAWIMLTTMIPEPRSVTVCQHIEELAFLLNTFLRKIVIMPGDPWRFFSGTKKVLHSAQCFIDGNGPGDWIFISLAITQYIGKLSLLWSSIVGIA